MSKNAKILKLKSKDDELSEMHMQLQSGRQVMVHSNERDELIEIAESNGEIIMKVRMTDDGPVISIQGAHLEMKSTETLSLEAKKVKIRAEEEAVVESEGDVVLDSLKNTAIKSGNDISVVGKMIYLN